MWKIIVLMGAPGAGKGTQARLLHERLNLPQISTGDMFRALKEAQTPLAAEVRALMEAGQLVPDDVTIRVVQERTARDDCKNGYILDGFPRTPAQAAMLETLAAEQGKKIQAIEIEVPRDLLGKRMIGRRNCPVCGEIYNIYFKPPQDDNVCDLHPETQLIHRSDDNADTVQARLTTYEQQTWPLLEYYKAANVLHVVDGTREPEAIYKDIEKIVTRDAPPVEQTKLEEITATELRARLDRGEEIQIIDVREPNEYEIAKIPGTKLIPLGQVVNRMSEIDPSRETIFHCKGGVRSGKAIEALRGAAFPGRMVKLKGGITAWSNDIDPTVPKY